MPLLNEIIYLGIDCGTQSTKTVALDGETGNIVASAAQKSPPVEQQIDPTMPFAAYIPLVEAVAVKPGT